jgi:hypothetical protein
MKPIWKEAALHDMADLKKLNEKFFTDPDWREMEELIMEYLEPFRSVLDVPSSLTNDQIATEVRGRQMMIRQLDKFLADTKMITRISKDRKLTYK